MVDQKIRDLLTYLSTNLGFVTSQEIAGFLKVSSKTVQRLIPKVNSIAGDLLVIAEKGRGYRIDYEKYLRYKDKILSESESTSSERQLSILKELLIVAPKPIKVIDLVDEHFISESVLQLDEKKIEQMLVPYDLQLIREKRELRIKGREKDIRDALMVLILRVDKETDLSVFAKKGRHNEEDLRFALTQVSVAEKMLKASMPYPYNINFVGHIYVLLNRTRHFVKIGYDKSQSEKLKDDVSMNPEIYSVCIQIVSNIKEYLHARIPEVEAYYLFEYLISSRISDITVNTEANLLARRVSVYYIDQVNELLGVEISSKDLSKELLRHIIPMLNRLEHGIRLKNALLKEIEMEYQLLFAAVQKASAKVSETFGLAKISDDESGFVALYFANYLETHRDKTQIVVICTTGIGTSELIAAKIQKELPNIEVVNVISNFGLEEQLKLTPNVDLLVSTIPLKNDYGIVSVLVSAVFTKQDKDNVLREINRKRHELNE